MARPRTVTAPAAAPPALVQSKYADSGSSVVASQNVVFDTGASAGNLIVGLGVSDATLTTSGITGLATAAFAVNVNGVYVWWKIAAGGETTLTLTPSVSDTVCAGLLEYSGIAAASPVDVTKTANGTGSTVGPVSAGSTDATAQAVELIIALTGLASFSAGNPPGSPNWSGGYTGRLAGATTFATGAQNQALFAADLITSSTGAQTTDVTWTNSANAWAAILVAFKGA